MYLIFKIHKKFHCFSCKLNFATSVGAMLSHKQSHLDDDYIKIGGITEGKFKNVRRPNEHTINNLTGKLFHGSDARLLEIRIPDTVRHDNDLLFCRKCDEFNVDYDNEMSMKKRAKHVEKMRRHERRCKKK